MLVRWKIDGVFFINGMAHMRWINNEDFMTVQEAKSHIQCGMVEAVTDEDREALMVILLEDE